MDATIFKVCYFTSYLYFREAYYCTCFGVFGDIAETDDHDSSLESFWADLLESSMKNDTSVRGGVFFLT